MLHSPRVRVFLLAVAALVRPADAQMDWKRRSAPTPATVPGTAMAYDTARGRVITFGGVSRKATAETWEWDGTRWKQRFPKNSPPARNSAAMAYDSARRRCVLFGGVNDFNAKFSDTWEWDGSNWTQKLPSKSPLPRASHHMTYDAHNGCVVVFGGLNSGHRWVGFYGDTWEWNGTTWTQRVVSPSPPPRAAGAMTYDVTRRRTILFGGFHNVLGYMNDTWEWDGTAWRNRSPSTSPPASWVQVLAYDARRQRTLLYQHGPSQPPNQTWEWNGGTWTQQKPPTTPLIQHGSMTATFDSARGRTVLTARCYPSGTCTYEYGPTSPGPVQVAGTIHILSATQVQLPISGAEVNILRNSTPVSTVTSDSTGKYSTSLPNSATPGKYSISATIRFAGKLHPPVTNYRYGTPRETPTLNPHRDPIALAAGTNNGQDIVFPKPIILVHGMTGSPASWSAGETLLRKAPDLKAAESIAHRAYPTWTTSYAASSLDSGHVENAKKLAQEIEQIKAAWSNTLPQNVPFDLICHSMGGLVARAYLHHHEASNSVDRVMTLGTPHLGCWFLFGLHTKAWLPQAVREMDPVYLATTFARTITNHRRARFILVGSDTNRDVEPEVFVLTFAPAWLFRISWKDDGVVSTWSALDQWKYLGLPVLARKETPETHLAMHTKKTSIVRMMTYLEGHR